MFKNSFISGRVTLEAAGLVALADLSTVAMRTALTGTASYIDALVLAPGMHQQQSADEVNRGETPITGAMTSGYFFHVENPATVRYLQTIGCTGHLVTAHVSPNPSFNSMLSRNNRLIQSFVVAGIPAALLYLLCPVLTIAVFALLGAIQDWWAFGVLWMLVIARSINVVVVKQRSVKGWKGAKERSEIGDLLILLSQDRWVRLKGSVDDLKAVTAGQWLQEMSDMESFAVAFATLLVYMCAALAGNASRVGSLLIACLLLCSVALLGLCNSLTNCLQMYDCVVRVEGEPKQYKRRLDMAADLIVESGRRDWAIDIGLVKHDESINCGEFAL
ncbi:uncharacterized protein BT62DRAFT_981914 [Guyanagaster necrorhizus]|uniref:Uncharacterized protein n=1 Tax=Guyanagaster necrorhizus TaxID=856835 RepID=A0A9P7VNT7_9AGAR|nr:uncharacterized protein BT62DRAFT_981914 [Guyanagaster necrorhizus MCA 3950]KAG7443745.1 hypothetical protein BT62DRAFT_981914 [Guyanagaster necrorhizus MCA 3950]